MSTVLVLQHHAVESLGIIEQALLSCGARPEVVRAYVGHEVPKRMKGYDGLVVMGGPMGVYEHDRYPWLDEEMHLIDRAVKDEVPILGVCLGSQLLAAVLGAEVQRGPSKEIGWHEVRLSELAAADELWAEVAETRDHFHAFHWHGDQFDVPTGAESLASSAVTPCQAFVFGRNAYGLLFHLEVTQKGVADMVGAFGDEVREAGLDGEAVLDETADRLADLHRDVSRLVLQRWAALTLGAT
jgi:GMP synthase (glutamine-hydrolysing)